MGRYIKFKVRQNGAKFKGKWLRNKQLAELLQ